MGDSGIDGVGNDQPWNASRPVNAAAGGSPPKRSQGGLQLGELSSRLHASHEKGLPRPTPEDEAFDDLRRQQQIREEQRIRDAINPSHYKVGGIETIDYMRAKSSTEEFRGHLRLTALKYLSRAGYKHMDVVEDFKKARWYLDRLISDLEGRRHDSRD